MATGKRYQKKRPQELKELKEKFLEYYRNLPIQKLAASSIGKDEDTVINWKKNDKKFSDQIASVRSEWALEKVRKIKNSRWLLERILSEHFSEKKVVDQQVTTVQVVKYAEPEK